MKSRPRLAPISRVTIPDEIVRRLTSFILDAALRPGDKMPSERELVDELGVSRSSLREAIKTLTAVGVLRVEGRGGMFVADGTSSLLTQPIAWWLLIGDQTTQEVVEGRRALEVTMAGLAAERATDEDVQAVERQLANMKSALNDPDAYTRCDAEFHLEIARVARNRVLSHVLETLRHVMRVWIYRTFTAYPQETLRSYEEHVPIMRAVKARDPEAARRAMAAHIDAAAQRWLSIMGTTNGKAT